jgi:hypothetical protein
MIARGDSFVNVNWIELCIGGFIGAALSIPSGIVVNNMIVESDSRKRKRRNQIEITMPRESEVLSKSRMLQPGICFEVQGTLEFLPEEHQIWLLVQDSTTSQIWPQGFADVEYRPDSKTWEGFIFANNSSNNINIVAVVAARSAQMQFRYYQRYGAKTNWAPLEEIPDECTNRKTVHAKIR